MVGLPIFLWHRKREIYGWVLSYNPLLLQQCSEDVFPMLQASSVQPLFLAHAIILLAAMGKTFLQTSSRQWLNATVYICLYDKRWEGFACTGGWLPFFGKIFSPCLYLNMYLWSIYEVLAYWKGFKTLLFLLGPCPFIRIYFWKIKYR